MSTLVRVCSVDDVPPESAIPVEVPQNGSRVELAIVHSNGNFLRDLRRVLARPDPAVGGGCWRRRDRVLPARLALRSAHRGTDRPAGDRAGPDLPLPRRGQRCPGRRLRTTGSRVDPTATPTYAQEF